MDAFSRGKLSRVIPWTLRRRHYVTDVHATMLHLLGLDSHGLEVPGRKRLEKEHGKVIREILA